MKKISVLDCTLRDGGYINNWEFGNEAICNIIKKLQTTGVEIIETGFLRDEVYDINRTIFTDMQQISEVIENRESKYSIMIEMGNYYPVHKICKRNEKTADLVRYVCWKRKMEEAYAYCKEIKRKDYELCIQPTRIDQYSEDEFRDIILMFNKLEPTAFYIVDTFGLLTQKQLVNYAKIADKFLDKKIILGYHSHNNMQQAMGNAIAFCNLDLSRDILVDSSVYGMGRGAGNLPTEILLQYLNTYFEKNYSIQPTYKIYDDFLKDIYKKQPWGYSMEYFISAINNGNPSYVDYFIKHGLDLSQIERIFTNCKDMIAYSEEKADKLLHAYGIGEYV